MITSVSNPKMKHVMQLNKKSKTRYQERVFVVEGMKMCMEVSREQIREMYVTERFLADSANWERLKGYAYEVVSDAVFSHISDTKTPQGILCLVQMPEYALEDLLGDGFSAASIVAGEPVSAGKQPHLLILESIQDPGNLGTMMRAGEGAGVTGVIMNRTTVDIFHPKTIRSTMGSLFRVPFYITDNLEETIAILKGKGVAMYAAHLQGQACYDEPDYTAPCGFLVGNEGNGLSPEIAGLADICVQIPMEGRVESLNAAVASALLMYEVSRQRRGRCRSATRTVTAKSKTAT